MHQVLMPIIDRMIDPIVRRLDQQDVRQREDLGALAEKIDNLAEIARHLDSQSVLQQTMKERLDGQENTIITLTARMTLQEGRNQVVAWLLGLVGAPIVVGLSLAGIAKLFGIELGK